MKENFFVQVNTVHISLCQAEIRTIVILAWEYYVGNVVKVMFVQEDV